MSSFLFLKHIDAKCKRTNAVISDRHLIGQLSSGALRHVKGRDALLSARGATSLGEISASCTGGRAGDTPSRSQVERLRLERGLPGTQVGLHRRGGPPDDSNVSTSRLRIGGSGPFSPSCPPERYTQFYRKGD